MRLNIAFLALLVTATLASGLGLKEFPLARDGDPLARAIVFPAALILAVAVVLLVRIVSRVEDLRRAGKEFPR
jgi:hypothetical protein